MNKNIEKEYKVLLSKEQFETLCSFYEPLHFVQQTNIYFDTEDRAIEYMRGAMRIRTKNGKHRFTLKVHENNELVEYECDVATNTIDALNSHSISLLLKKYKIHGPYIQRAKLITKRAIVEDEFAELCFDISEYNNTIDYEIEYEYKKKHDGLSLFQCILDKINVTYTHNAKSKIARALGK